MGLLDDFAGFIKTPEGQGLLSGVAGWAAGARKGTPWNNIGRGGLAGLSGYGNALEQQSQLGQAEQAKKLRDMQISEMLAAKAQKEKIQGLAMNSVLSPESQAIGKFGPTPEGAAAIGQFKPTFDTEGFLSGMMGIDPMQAMTLKKSMEPKPMTVGKNDRVILPTTGGGFKTVIDALPGDESVTSAIKEYQFAVGQGFKGTFQDFAIQQKRAGAGNTNVTYGAPVSGVDAAGNPVFFQPDKKGGAPAIVPGVRPLEGVKPPTEFEAKAGLYFKSMRKASETLDKIEKDGNPRVQPQEVISGDGATGNVMRSKDRQSYVQAQRQWIDSINRVRSGANLPEMEYSRAVKTFFPEFGDTPENITQKTAARKQEETAMQDAAGKALPKNKTKDDPLGLR